MKTINIVLFDNYTSLDALGPAEIFSKVSKLYEVKYFSLKGGKVMSSINAEIETRKIEDINDYDILLIPGGFGTRALVDDVEFITKLKYVAIKSEFVLCVCTGSALLAKTGLLNGKMATSNKLSWDWVIRQNEEVLWKNKARWVVDGKYYTSSGVTAGIDMALGFVSDKLGYQAAKTISDAIEYVWNEDKDNDPFSG
jgi:putative intracellular protease/amidase